MTKTMITCGACQSVFSTSAALERVHATGVATTCPICGEDDRNYLMRYDEVVVLPQRGHFTRLPGCLTGGNPEDETWLDLTTVTEYTRGKLTVPECGTRIALRSAGQWLVLVFTLDERYWAVALLAKLQETRCAACY
jgi:hypothetical protein